MPVLLYEANELEFLERAGRTQALLAQLNDPNGFDVAAWRDAMAAVLSEVRLPYLEPAARYRVRILGGALEIDHRHYADEEGKVHGLDMPTTKAEYLEFTGVYLGRAPAGPWRGQYLLELTDGSLATFTATDVLRIETIR